MILGYRGVWVNRCVMILGYRGVWMNRCVMILGYRGVWVNRCVMILGYRGVWVNRCGIIVKRNFFIKLPRFLYASNQSIAVIHKSLVAKKKAFNSQRDFCQRQIGLKSNYEFLTIS